MSLLGQIASIFTTKVEAIPHPFPTNIPKAAPVAVAPKVIVPDNLVEIGGKDFVQVDTHDGFQADKWEAVVNTRDDRVTPMDVDICSARSLNMVKYRELKRAWAAGKSSLQVAREMRNRRGYGVRTLEKYWAAFYSSMGPLPLFKRGAANPPQIPAKRGRGL